ncbi:MAG: heavy metal-binding domain-containing protein [Labilithrix sp.]
MRFLMLLLGLAACSPAPAPVASSPQDPSNPNAAEGVDPVAAVRTVATSPAASATAYTCPMHPEVTSPQPGHCPKCGMNLVPKK